MSKTARKIIFAVLILIISVINYSCKELKKKLLPSFKVTIPTINLTIPPIGFVSGKEVPVGALRTPINLDSTIKAKTAGTFGAASVSSIKVQRLTIKLSNADKTNNLANFESVRMKIYSGNDTALAEIANITFPQTYTDSLTITPAGSPEISNFLKGPQIGYNLFWKNRRTTTNFLKLNVGITLSVQ